jgi:predicted NBD/HSP70 family sugar kinase
VPGSSAESGLAALIAAASRSRVAAKVLEETAAYLGAGIANLINLFNPERIVLGGWAGPALGESLLPQIWAAAAAQSLRHPYRQTTIEMCQVGPMRSPSVPPPCRWPHCLPRAGIHGWTAPASGPPRPPPDEI